MCGVWMVAPPWRPAGQGVTVHLPASQAFGAARPDPPVVTAGWRVWVTWSTWAISWFTDGVIRSSTGLG